MSPPSHLPFPEFSAQVLQIYSSGRHARKTYLRVRQVLRELAAPALGVHSTADLTTRTVARWIASRTGPDVTPNPNTTNGLLGTASAICSIAVEEGYLTHGPNFRRIRPRESPARVNVPRPYPELERLLAGLLEARATWPGHRLCALAWTLALTGARLGEVVHALPGDLDLNAGSLAIVPRGANRLKTASSSRTVPLPGVLVEVLRPWVELVDSPWLFPGTKRVGPWTGGSYGARSLDQLQAFARGVGIPHITWHSLRHAYASHCLDRWDVPIWVVQKVLGHRDIRTTQRYLHLDDSAAIALACREIRYGPARGQATA
jgi:integrase